MLCPITTVKMHGVVILILSSHSFTQELPSQHLLPLVENSLLKALVHHLVLLLTYPLPLHTPIPDPNPRFPVPNPNSNFLSKLGINNPICCFNRHSFTQEFPGCHLPLVNENSLGRPPHACFYRKLCSPNCVC